MEKTMARAIYKRMEIGKAYTTYELYKLLDDDYYKYIPVEMQGKDVRKIVAAEMWKVVNAGYASTYVKSEDLKLVGGLRFSHTGNAPTKNYTFRYWVRTK